MFHHTVEPVVQVLGKPSKLHRKTCEHWKAASNSTAVESWEMIEVSDEMGRSGLEESRKEQKNVL